MLSVCLYVLIKWRNEILSVPSWIKYIVTISLVITYIFFIHDRINIDRIHQETLQQAENHHIVVVDKYAGRSIPNWAFFGSLPCVYEDTLTTNQISQLYRISYVGNKLHRFIVIFNLFMKNREIYQGWAQASDTHYHTLYHNSRWIVRFPKGYIASTYHPAQHAIRKDGTYVALRMPWTAQGSNAAILNTIGKKTSVIGEDFFNDFYYLIIPDKEENLHTIHFNEINLSTGESKPKSVLLSSSTSND